jgi:hypothetical protein
MTTSHERFVSAVAAAGLSHERFVSAVAAAGLVVMAVLCLSGGPVQAEPAASSGRVAIQILLPAPAAQPDASVPVQAPGSVPGAWGGSGISGGSDAGRILLLVVAAGAVGAFTVLQIRARSRHRRGKRTSRCQPGGN